MKGLVLTALLAGQSALVAADMIRVDFSGTIHRENFSFQVHELGIQNPLVGQTITGVFTYDTAPIPPGPAPSLTGGHTFLLTIQNSEWMSVPTVTFSGEPGFSFTPPCDAPLACDPFSTWNESSIAIGESDSGYFLGTQRIASIYSYTTLFDFELFETALTLSIPIEGATTYSPHSPFIPSSNLSPADPRVRSILRLAYELSANGGAVKSGGSLEVEFELTSATATVVPLPSSAILLLTAFGGLAVRRPRHQRPGWRGI